MALRRHPRGSRTRHPSGLAQARRRDPGRSLGLVAQQVLEAIRLSHPYGTTELLEGVVTRARELAIDSEREEVASEVRHLVARSGLSTQDFAERIGTSRSRLSTYMSGKVVPSAALIIRMRRAADHASEVPTRASSPASAPRQLEANAPNREPVKVRDYSDANGATEGSIMAAIINAQTAANEPGRGRREPPASSRPARTTPASRDGPAGRAGRRGRPLLPPSRRHRRNAGASSRYPASRRRAGLPA